MTNSLFITFFVFLLNIVFNYLYLKKNIIKSEIKHYFLFFIFLPLTLYFFIATIIELTAIDFISNYDLINSLILYLFLSFALIMTVPALNVTPPTLRIIFLFKEKRVINKKEIIQAFTRSELVDSRLELLAEDNLIIIKNKKIVLTTYGKIITSLFIMYKKILGEEFGSG